MRIILFIAILFSFTTAKSQSVVPFGITEYPQSVGFGNNVPTHDSLSNHKWFLTKYSGISTGISFFNGGNATFLAAPMGLQLNRRLNNNFYAFANVAVVPAFISLNPSLITTGNKIYQGNSFMSNSFNVHPSVSLGVMYINDARTFSISGSISAERGNYPIPPYYHANNGQNSVIHSER